MLALSIRQPFAELILRGIKTVEYRSRATRLVGERFWIYAAGKTPKTEIRVKDYGVKAIGRTPTVATSDNLVVLAPPPWMAELANELRLFPADLPTGVIVGSAVIERVSLPEQYGLFRWHLADVQRVKRMRKPKNHPQPVWFRPF